MSDFISSRASFPSGVSRVKAVPSSFSMLPPAWVSSEKNVYDMPSAAVKW